MRILHVCDGLPSAQSPGGGHVFFWQNLAALSELGHEVHLVCVNAPGPVEEDVSRRVASVTYAVPVEPSRRDLDHWLARVFRHETLLFRFSNFLGLAAQVNAAAARTRPDLIWADHISSLLVVPAVAPIVYGHLDFIHQLQPLRRAKRWLRRPDVVGVRRLQEIEFQLCRRVAFAVTVSNTDRTVFDSIDVASGYMPVVGSPIPRPARIVSGRARAVLLGRCNTAMNVSRRNLRREIWPHIEQSSLVDWVQVGEPMAKPDDDWRWMVEHFQVLGYVRELETVLRPEDLCLVPYRDDTGFRAKFVTAAGHGMVNIGFPETFHCAPEFIPGENCIAASSGRDFARRLQEYAGDAMLRRRLSEASRQLYDERFHLNAHLDSYASIVDRAAKEQPKTHA